MTLEVPSDLQYALLELIAHINSENYDAIPQDFINLGFSPEGVTAEKLKQSGITEGLTFAFRQLSQGGGPKKIQARVKADFQDRYGSELTDKELQSAARADMILQMEKQLEAEGVDVKGVTNVMEEMSKRNRELFQVPPYVLYVARAFSTLEGIGLSIDENYSIVQECYPYLARRLFTDRSPRAKRALRAMLGLSEETESEQSALQVVQAGAQGGVKKSSALSPSKLLEMSDGFTSYTAATADVDRDGKGQEAAVLEFVKLLLDEKGSTLQDILVEEAARLGDAATRSALKAGFVDSAPAKAAASALRMQREFLEQSPLYGLLPKSFKEAVVDRPARFPELLESLLSHNEDDEKILTIAGELQSIISARFSPQEGKSETISSRNTALDAETIRSLLADEKTRNLIVAQVPGVAALVRRLSAGLLRRAAYRSDKSHALPEETRKQLADINRRLAEAVDVPEEESILV
jgi:aarF domain-containing kinase